MDVMRLAARLVVLVLLIFVGWRWIVPARALPPADLERLSLVTEGLESPTSLRFVPDGRLFITELEGVVKIWKNGAILPENFAELPALAMNDRGLLGMAVDPEFSTNHYIYFYYIDKNDSFHKITRWTASGDVGTEETLIYSSDRIAAELHAGGGLDFGPDGKLYLSMGDSGPSSNAQDLSIPMGKVLRMNKDGAPALDNPFVGQADHDPYIWAYGFRNPFRMRFDQQTGNLYLGDVGYQAWEEINKIEKGGNYGWAHSEGDCGECGYINPIHAYTVSGGASVVIGPTYHGSMFPPEYQGRLVFGDYAKGYIRTIDFSQDGSVAEVNNFEPEAGTVIDIVEGADGALYYLTIFPGALYKIQYSEGNKAPTSQFMANPTNGEAPLTVQFAASSTDPEGDPLTYYWEFGDGTDSTEQSPSKTYANNGKYAVVLTTSDATHVIKSTQTEVQVGSAPVINVLTPSEGATYSAGETISYAAEARGATLTREIIFHHKTHIHPFLPEELIPEGSFVIPTAGESDPNQWYEIIFRATGADGLLTTATVNIYPAPGAFEPETNSLFLAEYFDNINLAGTPILTRNEEEINHWWHREPADPLLTDDQFSARWSKTEQMDPGLYEFKVTADDGVRLYLDEALILDEWHDQAATTNVVYRQIEEGQHVIKMEYYEAFGGAVAELKYEKLPETYTGEYFDNMSLTGEPVLKRDDPSINFVWNDPNSPDPLLPFDQFSVRWSKTEWFVIDQDYRFTITADDGVRFYIDGNLIVDNWTDHDLRTYTPVVPLTAGAHILLLEYYENGGGAVVSLVRNN